MPLLENSALTHRARDLQAGRPTIARTEKLRASRTVTDGFGPPPRGMP
jgi:hypothetical protein